MPSVNSRSIPKVCDSSTFTTPSLPTLSMASAMTLPTSSERALMAPTRAISALPLVSGGRRCARAGGAGAGDPRLAADLGGLALDGLDRRRYRLVHAAAQDDRVGTR